MDRQALRKEIGNVLEEMRGYRGSNKVKAAGTVIEWTPEIVEEWIRCREDPIYFAENYIKIINRQGNFEVIELYDYQKEIIRSVIENRATIAECARQSGKTTAMTALICWYVIFNANRSVAILANKEKTAIEILHRIRRAYEALPDWLQQGVESWGKTQIELENNSTVFAAATSNDNIRGFSIDLLFIDEAAWIENWEDFWTSVSPTVAAKDHGRICLVSTVNGLNHFYQITQNARHKRNNYNLISVTWQSVPGRDKKWYEATLSDLNGDTERFAQEYENRYLGSSGTLIAGWKLQQLVHKPPQFQQDGIAIYKPAENNRAYVLVADVARGKGLDHSAFVVIDVSEMPYQLVARFYNNQTTPADFAEVISRIGKQYNEAAVMVEINDIGEAVADMLYNDYEYENLLFTKTQGRGKIITQSVGKSVDMGVRTTTPVKAVGCSMIKLLVEQNQLEIWDYETIFEMSTFSKKGKSYEAEENHHDDLMMCLVLFGWLTKQSYFNMLTNINTVYKLRDKEEEQMEESMMPFGFISDGVTDSHNDLGAGSGGEMWQVVHEWDHDDLI